MAVFDETTSDPERESKIVVVLLSRAKGFDEAPANVAEAASVKLSRNVVDKELNNVGVTPEDRSEKPLVSCVVVNNDNGILESPEAEKLSVVVISELMDEGTAVEVGSGLEEVS